eukprot:m.238354 g.238354  ORF g.238354 m.238354 type:complete len:986 (+) comp13294_c0_seq1:36-2993(+)
MGRKTPSTPPQEGYIEPEPADPNGLPDGSSHLHYGIQMVKRAVQLEELKEFREARDLYIQAIDRLSAWRSERGDDRHARLVSEKIAEYRKRATALTHYFGLPEFTIVRGSAEYPIKYYGFIREPQYHATAPQSELLNYIDDAKRHRVLPWTVENTVVLTVSMYGVKIGEPSSRSPIIRQPLHNIASFCYALDDDKHLLLLVTGDNVTGPFYLHVIELVVASEAMDVCRLLKATIDEAHRRSVQRLVASGDSVNDEPRRAVPPPKPKPRPVQSTMARSVLPATILGVPVQKTKHVQKVVPDPTTRPAPAPPMPSAGSDEESDMIGSRRYSDGEIEARPARPAQRAFVARLSGRGNSSALEAANRTRIKLTEEENRQPVVMPQPPAPAPAAAVSPRATGDVVSDYMATLRSRLDPDELKEFAALLRAYRSNLSVDEYVTKLRVLFGPRRLDLLPGMQPFIGIDQRNKFNRLVADIKPMSVPAPAPKPDDSPFGPQPGRWESQRSSPSVGSPVHIISPRPGEQSSHRPWSDSYDDSPLSPTTANVDLTRAPTPPPESPARPQPRAVRPPAPPVRVASPPPPAPPPPPPQFSPAPPPPEPEYHRAPDPPTQRYSATDMLSAIAAISPPAADYGNYGPDADAPHRPANRQSADYFPYAYSAGEAAPAPRPPSRGPIAQEPPAPVLGMPKKWANVVDKVEGRNKPAPPPSNPALQVNIPLRQVDHSHLDAFPQPRSRQLETAKPAQPASQPTRRQTLESLLQQPAENTAPTGIPGVKLRKISHQHLDLDQPPPPIPDLYMPPAPSAAPAAPQPAPSQLQQRGFVPPPPPPVAAPVAAPSFLAAQLLAKKEITSVPRPVTPVQPVDAQFSSDPMDNQKLAWRNQNVGQQPDNIAWRQIVSTRKQAQAEIEEARRREEAAKEEAKWANVPAWKRGVLEKKAAEERERAFPAAERAKQDWLARRTRELADLPPYKREYELRREAKELGYSSLFS